MFTSTRCHQKRKVFKNALWQNVHKEKAQVLFDRMNNYTDHLGNIRLSYTQDPQTGALAILEENHYYPFGLQHKNYRAERQKTARWAVLANEPACRAGKTKIDREEELKTLKEAAPPTVPLQNPGYKYKFGGKELQEEFGIGMYDFGFRNYQPDLGRWFNVDPLTEKYPSSNPYEYAFNNPMVFVDPDGLENIIYLIYTDNDDKGREEIEGIINQVNSIFEEYGLETRLQMFSSEDKFDRNLLDDTDSVFLIGEEESVKAYDRENNITGNWGSNKEGARGWRTSDQGYTPEVTRQGENRASYATSKEKGDRLILFILHGLGHQSKEILPYDDHVYGKQNYPNIMNAGIDIFAYLRSDGAKASDIYSPDRQGNVHWKSRMLRNFGNKKAVDNYEKNDKKRIGPRREDGSF